MATPHGGVLQDLIARDASKQAALLEEVPSLESIVLSDRQLCDLELILNGGFSPLTGFNSQKDYEGIRDNMRLSTGELWSMPITLDVSKEQAETFAAGQRIVLRDPRDDAPLAIITVGDIYTPNKQLEAEKVFRGDPEHPAVRYLFDVAKDVYIGGELDAINLPKHYDYTESRKSPAQLRSEFGSKSWSKVVAFQTRNPLHRAHRELTIRAARSQMAKLLIHPVVGATKPGDIDHHTRVKVYHEIIKKYPTGMAQLALLPLAMRMGGDREALWHAIIRKNYGATHFIVGRDHAGPGSNSKGVDFYAPNDAIELCEKHSGELGIEIVPFRMVTYLPDEKKYAPIDTVPAGTKTATISGTQLRKALRDGTEIPNWFSYTEVVKILRTSQPPRPQQGFALYLSGLQYSGIKAFSHALQATFNQFDGGRHITLIDDDNLDKQYLSFVVPELVRSGAGVIIANSKQVFTDAEFAALKKASEKSGSFISVNIETALEKTKTNDRFGYFETAEGQQALADYKPVVDAELSVDLGSVAGVNVAIQKVVLYLEDQGFYKFD